MLIKSNHKGKEMKKNLNTIAMSMLLAPALFASSNLSSALKNGTTTGQVRYYYMTEDNAPTGAFHHFRVGVAFYTSSFINTNVNSQSTEPKVGHKNSRYVIGLMDATNPDNHRSTPGWKSVENSIGYGYAQGLEPLNSKAKGNYYGHISSNGLYVGAIKYNGLKNIKLQAWNYYAQNLFNLSYFQGNAHKHIDEYQFLAGLQYIYESAVGNGGNSNPALSYMRKNEISQTYSGKVGVGYKHTILTFAYTHTTDAGRFMFPRAWGKEALFTFQKRERSEGSGGSRAWLVALTQNFKSLGFNGLKIKIGFGEYFKPDVANHILNKYALPSYAQSNIDIHYNFHGAFKGLTAEYIFARKYALADTSNPKFIFRKINIDINNFILNYNF